jgi:hypothetical protein
VSIIAKAGLPSFEGDHLRYRQVEARCYDFAKHNPGQSVWICFKNEESEFWGHVHIVATDRGDLSEKSLSMLRGVKRNIDDQRNYDGRRVYSITRCDSLPINQNGNRREQ